MGTVSRRQFIQLLGAAGAVTATSGLLSCTKSSPRVIVVGGGFGGSTCAKYLKRFNSTLDVMLIEPSSRFVTCPFSNAVLGGLRTMDKISHGYKAQTQRGVHVVQDRVTEINADKHWLKLAGGKKLGYDKLVLSPGIDFRWDVVEGHSPEAAQLMPHAWQAGEQTEILKKQLLAMEDGDAVIIAPPGNPFRCPPGPYERASLIAHYLKQHKPKSKILILDTKDKFSKQPLFMQGWDKLYPGMIEWVAGSKGGRVARIDTAKGAVYNDMEDEFKGAVINLIPHQKAAPIAFTAGLTNDSGWCPVNQRTFESSIHKDVHILGDASIAGKMPKSGFAANSQGKVTAAAIVSELGKTPMPEPSYVNTCYSLVSPDYGISVAAVYRINSKGIYKVEGSGGVSPKDASNEFRQKEASYASGWYDSITQDAFG